VFGFVDCDARDEKGRKHRMATDHHVVPASNVATLIESCEALFAETMCQVAAYDLARDGDRCRISRLLAFCVVQLGRSLLLLLLPGSLRDCSGRKRCLLLGRFLYLDG
jgi:hypothetical protein